MEKLKPVSEQAVERAIRALRGLFGTHVSVTASEVAKHDLLDVLRTLDLEERTTGVLLPVVGDVEGSSLVVFPHEMALLLSDILLEREPGTTRTMDEGAEASLKEAGNVICGSYVSALSNALQVEMMGGVPEFSYGLAASSISQFAKRSQKVLLMEILIERDGVPAASVKGHAMFLCATEDGEAMMGMQTDR